MNFSELGLCEPLLKAITELGFETPMPVQEAVIPHQLTSEQDLVALAQTGTGKTAAYGLPLLQRMVETPNENIVPQAIVLSPTRELCLQIADDLESFSKYIPQVRVLAVYGGANIETQIRALRQGVQIIVATPGRLIDLMHRGAAKLDAVQTIVLDEADEMLSMGFSESIDAILEGVPSQHRTLLFSATMSKEIERIAKNYLNDAKEIVVGSRNEGAEHVNHIYYMVQARDKYLALKRVVDYYPKIYAIIFCRTRMETKEIADKLIQDGYNADALHGDLSQQQRDLTMLRFRQHMIQLLVATDVAARGLDVDDLTHVINYGMPDDIENYTHRSGRTGRAGKKGTSIAIIHSRERSKIKEVEREIKKEFEHAHLPSGKEICAKQMWKVVDDIEHVEVDDEEIADFLPEVRRRLEWLDKDDIIARVISREFGRFLQYYANAQEIVEVDETAKKEKKGKGDKQRGPVEAQPGFTRIFITLGKMDGFYARELITFINRNIEGPKIEIGRIDLTSRFSFFEVPERDAKTIVHALQGLTHKGRRVGVDFADRAPGEGEGEKKVKGERLKVKGDSSKSEKSTPQTRQRRNEPFEPFKRTEGASGRRNRNAKESKKEREARKAEKATSKKKGASKAKKGSPKEPEPKMKMTKDDWRQFFK